jgi:primase-polymerase (primpol)-like protein
VSDTALDRRTVVATLYHSSRESKTPKENIPQALKEIPQWMGTRFERRKDGKLNKPPYSVVPGKHIQKAAKTDPHNWTTFENAHAALERRDVDAIGFVFAESDPFFVVDLDGVLDPETGEIDPTAAEIIHTMDTYAELSCSGRGVHVIGVGAKPIWSGSRSNRMGPEVEMYDRSRFMVLTGRGMGELGSLEPQKRQEPLEWLCQRLWGKAERLHTRPPTESVARDIEDDALLERARNSRTGAKFAECPKGEVRRITIPRTPVNKGKKKDRNCNAPVLTTSRAHSPEISSLSSRPRCTVLGS